MPYTDPVKKKLYYHRHAKHRLKEWRKESGWWNKYQREYKAQKKKEQVIRIKKDAILMNISDVEDDAFKAWVLLMLIIETGILQVSGLAKRLNYTKDEVGLIMKRWKENNILIGGKINIEIVEDDFQNHIEFICIAMCGSGMLKRQTI